MLPSTPIEDETPDADSSSEKSPPLRKYQWTLDERIVQDWEFFDALARLSLVASEKEGINPFWKLTYEQFALFCNNMSALIFRQDRDKEFGP